MEISPKGLKKDNNNVPCWLPDPCLNIVRVGVVHESRYSILEARSLGEWPACFNAECIEQNQLTDSVTTGCEYSLQDSSSSDNEEGCDSIIVEKGGIENNERRSRATSWEENAFMCLNSSDSLQYQKRPALGHNPAMQLVIRHKPMDDLVDSSDEERLEMQAFFKVVDHHIKHTNVTVPEKIELARLESLDLAELIKLESANAGISLPKIFIEKLERLRMKMNYARPMHEVQERVCYHLFGQPDASHIKNDAIFLSPCGSGKSACYAMAAKWLEKIVVC